MYRVETMPPCEKAGEKAGENIVRRLSDLFLEVREASVHAGDDGARKVVERARRSWPVREGLSEIRGRLRHLRSVCPGLQVEESPLFSEVERYAAEEGPSRA